MNNLLRGSSAEAVSSVSANNGDSEVCPLINKAFGISDCKSLDSSFSKIPGARQFYSPADSIAPFHDYLRELVCGSDADQKCGSRIDHLQNADYVDITYDAISQSLVLSAFTSQQAEPWQLTIAAPAPEQKVEIGVLGLDNAIDPEGITLSGFIHVVGVDNKLGNFPPSPLHSQSTSSYLSLEPVYFTFPAKHHLHPATYSLSIPEPAGLHPKLELSITSPVSPPREDCTLNAYYTLPRTLFVDKYQLSSANPQLLESLKIRRLRDVRGEIDLEAPAWESDLWGSSILVEVDPARHDDGDGTNMLKVELPVHTRYQEPRNVTSAPTQFALPSVFWACKSEDWTGMSKNPFNRVRLGYEHMFPEQTMFYHLAPAEEGWKAIDVPVLDVGYAEMVKVGTVGVIVAGFVWVLLKTITTAVRAQRREVGPKKTQ